METSLINEIVEKYRNFYENTNSATSSENDIVEIKTMLEFALQYSPSAFCIINFQKMKYEYFSPRFMNFLGDQRANYINLGPAYAIHNMKADHKTTFVMETMPELRNQLSLIPMEERINYQFTYNLWIYGNEKFHNLRQENRYLKSMPEGTPILSFANVYEITSLIPDNIIRLAIHKITDNTFDLVFQKDFYTDGANEVQFTSQEKKILAYAQQGFNTNRIAEALHISPHTVKKHRKNMVKKAGAKNMQELVVKYR